LIAHASNSKPNNFFIENESKLERLMNYLNTVRGKDGMVGNAGKIFRSFNNAGKYDTKMGKRNSEDIDY
jgi:hypothetical protein